MTTSLFIKMYPLWATRRWGGICWDLEWNPTLTSAAERNDWERLSCILGQHNISKTRVLPVDVEAMLYLCPEQGELD
ncbi:hypothetical protein Hdeb2414_s0021g00579541 [Helianthus debilis subsp. tardiflorus]